MTTEPPDKTDENENLGTPLHVNAARSRFSAHDDDFRGANDEAVALRISHYEEEHRDLDAAILALEISAPYERLTIARLKKKKLQLKDQIQSLKDAMLPDIIA